MRIKRFSFAFICFFAISVLFQTCKDKEIVFNEITEINDGGLTVAEGIEPENQVLMNIDLPQNTLIEDIQLIDEIGRELPLTKDGEFIAEKGSIVTAFNQNNDKLVYVGIIENDEETDGQKSTNNFKGGGYLSSFFKKKIDAESTAEFLLAQVVFPMFYDFFKTDFNTYSHTPLAEVAIETLITEDVYQSLVNEIKSEIEKEGGIDNIALKAFLTTIAAKFTGGLFVDCFSTLSDIFSGNGIEIELNPTPKLELSRNIYNKTNITNPYLPKYKSENDLTILIIDNAKLGNNEESWEMNFSAYNALPVYVGVKTGFISSINGNEVVIPKAGNIEYFIPSHGHLKGIKNAVSCSGWVENMTDFFYTIKYKGTNLVASDYSSQEGVIFDMDIDNNYILFLPPSKDKRVAIMNILHYLGQGFSLISEASRITQKDSKNSEIINALIDYILLDDEINQLISSGTYNASTVVPAVGKLCSEWMENNIEQVIEIVAKGLISSGSGKNKNAHMKLILLSLDVMEFGLDALDNQMFEYNQIEYPVYIPDESKMRATLLEPANGFIGIATDSVKLKWKAPEYDGGNDVTYSAFLALAEDFYSVGEKRQTATQCIVNDLEPGMTYKWQVITYFSKNNTDKSSSNSSVWEFTTKENSIPTVITYDAKEVGENKATIDGDITDNGGSEVDQRGICWNTTGNPKLTDKYRESGTGTGKYSITLTGLQPNTKYFVRAFGRNNLGVAYGNEISFSTNQNITLPTLTTTVVTDVTQTTATSGGNITFNGNVPVTARGVVWSTAQNPTLGNKLGFTSNGDGTGVFTSQITDLNSGTTYYVRAYATNSKGTAYGEQETFTSDQSIPEPVITSVTPTQATLGEETTFTVQGSNLPEGLAYHLDDLESLTEISGGNGNTRYFRGMPSNSAGTKNGVIKDQPGGTTLFTFEIEFLEAPSLPTIMTNVVTDITENSATSGGNVTSDGNSQITSRGVCWSTSQNPTTTDSKTTDGAETGSFTSNLTGLQANTTYYVRAYTTNSEGTAYGNQRTFTTNQSIPDPMITSVTPTQATLGEETTFTVQGSNLPEGLAYHLDDLESLTEISGGNGNTRYFRGMPSNSAGTKNGVIKDQPGGTTLHSFEVVFVEATSLPTVTTNSVTNKTENSATSGGNVISDGNSSVTTSGVCWSTSQNPTITNAKTTDGTGTGSFTSNLTGLQSNTTYYVRAYATNSIGTAYGNEISFTTSDDSGSEITFGSFTDSRDSKTYKTVKIGNQEWMAENLAYLPSVSPPSDRSYEEPYYYVYGYLGTSVSTAKATANYGTYGVLYNWSAALTACPSGWHLPTDEEWTELENALTGADKGSQLAGNANLWQKSGNLENSSQFGTSGFSGLPGGCCDGISGNFGSIGYVGFWWSSTEGNTNYAWRRSLDYSDSYVYRRNTRYKYGLSVRCVRD